MVILQSTSRLVITFDVPLQFTFLADTFRTLLRDCLDYFNCLNLRISCFGATASPTHVMPLTVVCSVMTRGPSLTRGHRRCAHSHGTSGLLNLSCLMLSSSGFQAATQAGFASATDRVPLLVRNGCLLRLLIDKTAFQKKEIQAEDSELNSAFPCIPQL